MNSLSVFFSYTLSIFTTPVASYVHPNAMSGRKRNPRVVRAIRHSSWDGPPGPAADKIASGCSHCDSEVVGLTTTIPEILFSPPADGLFGYRAHNSHIAHSATESPHWLLLGTAAVAGPQYEIDCYVPSCSPRPSNAP